MKLKSFEAMPSESDSEEQTESGEKIVQSQNPKKNEEVKKVDRRPELPKKEIPPEMLSDEELVERAISAVMHDEDAAKEISDRVNQSLRDARTATIKRQTRAYDETPLEELVDRAIFEVVSSEDMAREITKRVNQSFADRRRVTESKKDDQARRAA